VNSTLAELGAGDKPTIMVFNKIDSFSYVPKEENDLTPIKRENISLAELKKTWMANMNDNCMFISAKERNNIDELKVLMYKHIRAVHVQRFPYNDFLYPDIARTGGEDEL
jgi:GTP-binding protein HflX